MEIDRFSYNVINILNEIRENPSSFASELEKEKKYFSKNYLKLPNEQYSIKTKEGIVAYEDAINFLNTSINYPELKMHKSLFDIAFDYLCDIENVEIEKINSIDINKYVNKYGNYLGNLTKLIEFGGNSPKRVITNFIVNDGDKNRGQRQRLFNKNAKYIGVANGNHPIYNIFTVLIIANDFKSWNKRDDAPVVIEDDKKKEKEENEKEDKKENDKKDEDKKEENKNEKKSENNNEIKKKKQKEKENNNYEEENKNEKNIENTDELKNNNLEEIKEVDIKREETIEIVDKIDDKKINVKEDNNNNSITENNSNNKKNIKSKSKNEKQNNSPSFKEESENNKEINHDNSDLKKENNNKILKNSKLKEETDVKDIKKIERIDESNGKKIKIIKIIKTMKDGRLEYETSRQKLS